VIVEGEFGLFFAHSLELIQNDEGNVAIRFVYGAHLVGGDQLVRSRTLGLLKELKEGRKRDFSRRYASQNPPNPSYRVTGHITHEGRHFH